MRGVLRSLAVLVAVVTASAPVLAGALPTVRFINPGPSAGDGVGTDAAVSVVGNVLIVPRTLRLGSSGYVIVSVNEGRFFGVTDRPALGWQWCWLVNPRPPECDEVVCTKLPSPAVPPICPVDIKPTGKGGEKLLFFDREGLLALSPASCGEAVVAIQAIWEDDTMLEAKGTVTLTGSECK